MESLEDIKSALTESLETQGVFDDIRARIRSEIFKYVEGEDGSKPTEVSPANSILNELIVEYLRFNSYSNSLNVFQLETGAKSNAKGRAGLCEELNIAETNTSKQLPLLYSLITVLKEGGAVSLESGIAAVSQVAESEAAPIPRKRVRVDVPQPFTVERKFPDQKYINI